MNLPTAFGFASDHDATPTACVNELIKLIREGRLIEEIRANPAHVLGCIMIVGGGILHRYSPVAPIIFGVTDDNPLTLTSITNDFDTAILELADLAGIEMPALSSEEAAQPHNLGPIANLLLAKLLEELRRIILDYFT